MTTNQGSAAERLRPTSETDWSLSSLIRIDDRDAGLTPADVRALLAGYDVTDAVLVDSMTGRARVEGRYPWSDLRAYYSPSELQYFGYEAAAASIRSFELSLVHGLLQTRDYARAMLADGYGEHWDVFDRRWQARERRQQLHHRSDPPAMAFVVDEGAVRRIVGSPGIMRRQLERLVDQGAQPHVDLRVLPFGAGAHNGMSGPFTVLGFAGEADPDLLFKEGSDRTSTTSDDPVTTRSHATTFRMLQAQALSPHDTADLLRHLITGLA